MSTGQHQMNDAKTAVPKSFVSIEVHLYRSLGFNSHVDKGSDFLFTNLELDLLQIKLKDDQPHSPSSSCQD